MIEVPREISRPILLMNVAVIAASVVFLPFGEPTVFAAAVFAVGAALAEWKSGFFASTDRHWVVSLMPAVLMPAYTLDPGWWILLIAAPLLLGHRLAARYPWTYRVMWLTSRTAAVMIGAWVAHVTYTTLHLHRFSGAATCAAVGLLAALLYRTAVFSSLLSGAAIFELVVPWALVSEAFAAYLGLIGTWLWLHERSLLWVLVPLFGALVAVVTSMERAHMRARMFSAVAEGQVHAHGQSILDTAWTVGHAVDRISGPETSVEMAVVGGRLKYYEITNGVPSLTAHGSAVWDHPWVTLLHESHAHLVHRFEGASEEYLFRLGSPQENAMMFRLVTPKTSEFNRRIPEKVMRDFVESARTWIQPAEQPRETVFAQVRDSAAHLSSLLEYPGPKLPVREILTELHRIERLIATALTGAHIPHKALDEEPQAIPVGVWPDDRR